MNELDFAPTWEAAAEIYISVLMNPTASDEATELAQEDLLAMARTVDRLKAEQEAEADYQRVVNQVETVLCTLPNYLNNPQQKEHK